MIIAVDCETQGLDATKFVQGCVMKYNGVNKIFYDKKEMWDYVIRLGKKEAKRKKVLSVYAHNHYYDFCAYADLFDSNIKFYSEHPFIACYMQGDKEIIKFLDSGAIFQRMTLKELGELVGLAKLETPKILLSGKKVHPILLKTNENYVKRDCEIVIRAIEFLKSKLYKDGVRPRRLMTVSQLAINYIINKLRQSEHKMDGLMFNKDRGMFIWTQHGDRLHPAYRQGRVEAFKVGEFEGVTYVDCNSLYPYSMTKIRVPNMRTEAYIEPSKEWFDKNGINKIGVTRCMVHNKGCEIGLLSVRTSVGNYFPSKGKYLIGQWTNLELRKAIEEGYEILEVDWCVIYDDLGYNPLAEIYQGLYKKRMYERDEFNRYFYKMIMNHSIGKFGQDRDYKEYVIDSVEEAKRYVEQNYKIIKGIGLNYMYEREIPQQKKKKYYCPIIPIQVTAYARCHMFDYYKMLGDDIIYTDNDSCVFVNNHVDEFPISRQMGGFKVEYFERRCKIYGRKAYSIGSDIKVSGVVRANLNKKDFELGEVKVSKMVTLKQTKDLKKVGSFVHGTRDLNAQLDSHEEMQELMGNQKIYIDEHILKNENPENLKPYMDFLKKQVGKSATRVQE